MTATTGVVRPIPPRQNGKPPPCVPLRVVDLGAQEFWEHEDEVPMARLPPCCGVRAPISFQHGQEMPGFPLSVRALARFEDVLHVGRRPKIFSLQPTSTTISVRQLRWMSTRRR
jgi:hypothetical protein